MSTNKSRTPLDQRVPLKPTLQSIPVVNIKEVQTVKSSGLSLKVVNDFSQQIPNEEIKMAMENNISDITDFNIDQIAEVMDATEFQPITPGTESINEVAPELPKDKKAK